ncbi:TPA: HipA N-terminal domain-containing protein [Providencia stuartii]|uniref:HipA N-terminal domain-containing protein n=1 Tax=Providencia stuartii TaxID=588 RepID=UPI00076B39A0|nr:MULTISPECIES: HipA N-terminal domain-containing protein [Providencia]AMG65745.1 HipA protein [Providencia stuartii]MBN5560873.1 HipA N-terminal domain-containing protein [Providencia stuartii]MBN5599306.1 HipA N-terminal domain-containing protein [Providencia stuartii]MBN5603638.1 HipA N-terminal domain-containing protein [Providencia stuartii]MCL8323839.1 HipA N-terminal domain-containing protein [Providencia thailandensis]
MVMEVINVNYHNQTIGALSFDTERKIGAFEYEPSFLKKGIELSPLKMPLSSTIFRFPELDFNTFKGLPGLIADSLPDDFGNAVIDETIEHVSKWPTLAKEWDVPKSLIDEVNANLRLNI